MKKLLAVLLGMLLLLGVAAAETADVTGTWYLNEISAEGVSVNPVSVGMDMSITINADGTALVTLNGEDTDGSWAMEDGKVVVTMEGDPQAFTPEDGKLVAEEAGAKMILEREKADLVVFTPGEAKADATMDDYNGTWNAFLVDMMGMQMTLEEMGLTMQVVVENGKAVVLEGMGDEMVSSEADAEVKDGLLLLMLDGMDTGSALQYLDGDMLEMIQPVTEGMSMSVYFERVPEEVAN